MGPLPLLTPPPPIQACRALLWWEDGNPGTWQKAGDLLAPRSSCLSSPSLSLSWPSSFIFFSCSLSLPVSPPPLLSLLCPMSYFSVHLFYFKASFFSLKYWKKGNSPSSFKQAKHRAVEGRVKQKGRKKAKLEFSYGRVKETTEGKGENRLSLKGCN